MTSIDQLIALKRKISPEVLRVPGVSGLGLPNNRLTVYLAEDRPEIRQAVEKILLAQGVELPVAWTLTGAFHRQ